MSEGVALRMVERRRRMASALGGAPADVTAPTLTLPLGLPLGDTSGYLGVTTNEANGTLYYVVTTSATPPSAAQVKAGQNDGGTSAVYAGSQAISSTGAKSATAAGLSSATAYYAYFMHEDAVGNQSSVSSASTFTTLTTGTSDTSFDNLIAAASVAPADLRKGYIARFIGALYTAGVWSKMDVTWVLAAHDEQFGRLNWITPASYTCTVVNSVTFTVDRGFAGDGISGCLDTGWAPSTDAVQFTQDNAHISVYQRTGGGNGNEPFTLNNSNRVISVAAGTGTSTRANLNSSTQVDGPTGGGAQPLFGMGRRNDSANVSILRDGAQVTAPTAAASGALQSGNMRFGVRTTSTFLPHQVAGGSLGAYLDDTEAAALYAAWHTYMVAVGADT